MSAHTSNGAVIVTGASRRLGRGVALELARTGYSVVINFRSNQEAADATVAECRRIAGDAASRFIAVQADVSQAEDRERLVAATCEEFGTIAALVNNAGVAPAERKDIVEASEQSFESLMHINLQGPYFLTQLVARHWLNGTGSGDGAATTSASVADETSPAQHRAVVFVTSISAATVSLSRGEYCISKAGLAMAAQLWAARLAPHGIGVYELRPGIMETDMTSAVKAKYDPMIAAGLVPSARWGKPADVGKAVRSLISGDFAFSPGAVIYSDGGFNISRL